MRIVIYLMLATTLFSPIQASTQHARPIVGATLGAQAGLMIAMMIDYVRNAGKPMKDVSEDFQQSFSKTFYGASSIVGALTGYAFAHMTAVHDLDPEKHVKILLQPPEIPAEKISHVFICAHGYTPYIDGEAEQQFTTFYGPLLPPELLNVSAVIATSHPGTPKTTSFACRQELNLIRHAHQLARTRFPNAIITLVGFSNGAASMLNALHLHQEITDHVDRVLLFAPYYDIRDISVMRNFTPLKYCIKFLAHAYNPTLAPHLVISNHPLDKKLPIFIAHGLADKVIPQDHGVRLAALLRQQGHDVTTKFDLSRGHVDLFFDTEQHELAQAVQDFLTSPTDKH